MTNNINYTVSINASASVVWQVLTDPIKMKVWMAEPEMELQVITDWNVGKQIIIKGFHHLPFTNTGTVLQFEPFKIIQYNYRSSISYLLDTPDNYTCITFRLESLNEGSILTVTASNFPTETIYKHVDFYWRTTIGIIKRLVEKKLFLINENEKYG